MIKSPGSIAHFTPSTVVKAPRPWTTRRSAAGVWWWLGAASPGRMICSPANRVEVTAYAPPRPGFFKTSTRLGSNICRDFWDVGNAFREDRKIESCAASEDRELSRASRFRQSGDGVVQIAVGAAAVWIVAVGGDQPGALLRDDVARRLVVTLDVVSHHVG